MVDREAFDAYQLALDANARLVRDAVARLVAECEGLPDAERAMRLLEGLSSLVRDHGRVASEVVREFYQAQRDEAGAEGDYVAQAAPDDPVGWLAEDVREAAARERGRSLLTLPGKAVERVMGRADETLALNVARDPAHPMWAFVPHAGACGWCVMLGSRGWAYHGQGTALAARHDHCTCAAVADFDVGNPRLAGYDPDAMYDAYASCAEAVSGDVDRLWGAMTDEQRLRHTHKGKPSKDAFRRNLIAREMGRRDRDWLQTGKVPKWTSEMGARPSRKEVATANRLCSNGIAPMFRKTREDEGKRTSDVYIGTQQWEFKQPTGSGKNNINNQFNEASGQSDRLVIDASTSPFGFDGVCERALDILLRRNDFIEVVVIDDNRFRRLVKN